MLAIESEIVKSAPDSIRSRFDHVSGKLTKVSCGSGLTVFDG